MAQAVASRQQGSSPLLSCSVVVVPGCAQLLMPVASEVSDSLLEARATQLLASFPAGGAESAAGPGLEMQLGGELRLPAAAGADDASSSSPSSPHWWLRGSAISGAVGPLGAGASVPAFGSS